MPAIVKKELVRDRMKEGGGEAARIDADGVEKERGRPSGPVLSSDWLKPSETDGVDIDSDIGETGIEE